ncbi:hypothetical protein CC1G_15103 [Coprinopsis cinerea okayama7|uniref:Fungal-type protein kinase domain-containing protein n=1 Tax=Coprinopsis cinerea (strain Okayama-7 / 130 / ATCC MYA-4618 / FGSC 9003) TaxID=240176 RepID=D6RPG5_COPC7|nr:hypothetical protein CC1G_15103 [Coprinopsis cinerea okayama7\|eukprot:XP_002910462.1 hypothetical protein CC1G_15103 [Coprinopsis cinerea okayama7\
MGLKANSDTGKHRTFKHAGYAVVVHNDSERSVWIRPPLKKEKALVARGRPLRNEPSSSKQKAPFTHVFKTLNTLFRTGSSAPNRIAKSFQTVGNAIRRALGKVKAATNECSIRLDETSEHRSNACITGNPGSQLQLTDIVVPIEVTSTSVPAESKILSNAAKIFNEDPRRRFSYGVTVEDRNVSLWYFSRSLTIRSEPFDVQQHSDILAHVFVSFFCSSYEQLGFDPLVTLLHGGTGYVYELPPDGERTVPLFYKTLEVIWEHRPTRLSGRYGRGWKVEQVHSASDFQRIPGTSTMALKDSSVDVSIPVESEVQEALFRDIAAFGRGINWKSHPLSKDSRVDSDLMELEEVLRGDNFEHAIGGEPFAGVWQRGILPAVHPFVVCLDAVFSFYTTILDRMLTFSNSFRPRCFSRPF